MAACCFAICMCCGCFKRSVCVFPKNICSGGQSSDDMLCYRPSFLLCLSYDKKTRRDGMPVLNGIDISNYQRGLDVRTIKADFVIVKASEGIGYEDPSCHTFAKAALSSKKSWDCIILRAPAKRILPSRRQSGSCASSSHTSGRQSRYWIGRRKKSAM